MTQLHPSSPWPRLKPIEIPGHSRAIEMVAGDDGSVGLTVGRGADCDVVLDGDSHPSVSSLHARFVVEGGRLSVIDEASRNGVYVGGEAIDARRVLEIGDQVRLGSVGPRFLVVGGRGLDDTVFVRREALGGRGAELARQARSTRTLALLGVLVAVAVAGVLFWRLDSQVKRSDKSYTDRLTELQLAAEEAERVQREQSEAREQRIAELEGELEAQREELSRTLDDSRVKEAMLLERIDELEATGSSRAEVAAVQKELEATRRTLETTRADLGSTNDRLKMFDPVSLAQQRLSGVAGVRSSIVLIENRTRIRNEENGEFLRLLRTSEGVVPGFEGPGEEFAIESTGSGFCIDEDGWILTNQHVVEEPDSGPLAAARATEGITAVHEIEVVFSGTNTRIPARVEAVSRRGVDLALLKIEPFEGMPVIDGFRTDAKPPLAGSDIFLFGFPLGYLAVQEGETVIASTFRGILSRNVGGQMQVDAGVHPGNSGGPITDAQGRVVGVVVSVQALPDRTAVYTIGYGIPIAEASELWPRPAAPPDDATPTVK